MSFERFLKVGLIGQTALIYGDRFLQELENVISTDSPETICCFIHSARLRQHLPPGVRIRNCKIDFLHRHRTMTELRPLWFTQLAVLQINLGLYRKSQVRASSQKGLRKRLYKSERQGVQAYNGEEINKECKSINQICAKLHHGTWKVMSRSLVDRYQRFGCAFCLHLKGRFVMRKEAANSY